MCLHFYRASIYRYILILMAMHSFILPLHEVIFCGVAPFVMGDRRLQNTGLCNGIAKEAVTDLIKFCAVALFHCYMCILLTL
jgi:hypothetical protein